MKNFVFVVLPLPVGITFTKYGKRKSAFKKMTQRELKKIKILIMGEVVIDI